MLLLFLGHFVGFLNQGIYPHLISSNFLFGHILQLPPLDARHGIEMPISQEVARVLFDHQSPRRAAEALMARTLKFE